MATSFITPERVKMESLNDGVAVLRLRKNIVEKEMVNDLTKETKPFFEYDEKLVQITYTEDVINDAKSKFDVYWNLAVKQEKELLEMQEKERQMKELIKNYGQLKINKALSSQIDGANSELGDMSIIMAELM